MPEVMEAQRFLALLSEPGAFRRLREVFLQVPVVDRLPGQRREDEAVIPSKAKTELSLPVRSQERHGLGVDVHDPAGVVFSSTRRGGSPAFERASW